MPRGTTQAFARNEMVIAEGASSDALFILVSGQLKVFTRDSNGREVVYNILQPRELFGEMFLDGGTRSASVKTMAASECLVIEAAHIWTLIAAYPDFAKCLIQSLVARLRHTTGMIKSLVLNDVYERTTALLNQVAITEGESRVVPASMTQQEIADRIGATREMVNHVIGELMKGGFIKRDDKRRLVFVKNLPARW
ncbi:Crp/Fnr family transcriptional regulator [Pseudoxanthomonas wuyuanensis]|nr:Crp/Fnr family transcriptional regulator [Pseudoxanthomonas wuyuanensis]